MEDAKELSVQSIVNSNRLLLLNHPMVDEKISFQFHPFFNDIVSALNKD